MSAALSTEGRHKTISKSITPVQVGDEKVHLVIRQSRQTREGIEYNGFDTLWIFTKIDGRWGGARTSLSFKLMRVRVAVLRFSYGPNSTSTYLEFVCLIDLAQSKSWLLNEFTYLNFAA